MVANHIAQNTARIQCTKCNTTNRAGTIFCEFCGSALLTAALPFGGTTQIESMDKAMNGLPNASSFLTTGRGSEFRQGMKLQLTAVTDYASVEITPLYGRNIILGRSDPVQEHKPEVDLTDLGGYAKGISRSHAAVVFINQRVQIMDMNSSNGTYINEEQIPPRKPVELRNGDKIRLGKLELLVHFLS